MEDQGLNKMFEELSGSFDLQEPVAGHRERFRRRLDASKNTHEKKLRGVSWWKPLAIAASVALLLATGILLGRNAVSMDAQIAEISPQAHQSELYFAGLIEEQIETLQALKTPDNQILVEDALSRLEELEAAYRRLELDLLEGGNNGLILKAMIHNLQTRIDLLQEVVANIESINTLKTNTDENFTI